MSVTRPLLLLLLAAHALGQGETEPYFSLNTSRTFAPGTKPSVGLSAWNVESLDFRVYRINDPIKFFQQLDSPHEFGGRVQRPSRQKTAIERIHEWKRGMRARIRRNLRGQFTESPSAHLESIAAKEPPTAAKGTEYAQAPLLNPQQLAVAFHHVVRAHHRWDTENVEIPVKERGVYLVEAVHEEYRAYTILMVTNLVMVSKTGAGRIVNFVVDRATGQPVGGAQISIVTREGHRSSVTTSADGLAEIPVTGAHPGEMNLVAKHQADIAVNPLADYAFRSEAERSLGYVYTDRPVYRPGHTVHFKAVLRLRNPEGYAIPAGKAVQVEIQDPEQKAIYQKSLTVNANGSIHDEITLPPAAGLGSYSIQLHTGDQSYNETSFEVEEYKKPEYEVRVTPSVTRVLQGQPIQAVIDARYYFGEPVSGAKVAYTVHRSRYWFPLWYDPDDDIRGGEAADDSDGGYYGDEQVLEESGQLDQDGKLSIKFDTEPTEKKFDVRYRIEARVTDEGKREITGRGAVIGTYGTYIVNATPESWFYQPGARVVLKVEARDYDSKPISARVHVELRRHNWRAPNAGRVAVATDVTTKADGYATAEFTAPAGGSYHIYLTSHTPEGRDVESQTWFWVAGAGDYDFGEGNRRTVQIVPDKKTYAAGETAKILVITGAPSAMLFSVEGRDLRNYRVQRSSDSTAIFEVPVTAQHEPGFWVAVSYVRKGNLYQGQKYVKVPPVEHQLNIAVTADKPQYLPGDNARYTLQVNDAAGRPVPRAELSLGVVDEAIYAIRRDMTQDPIAFFFGREWNSVFTEDSMSYYFSGEAGKRQMKLASLRPASKLAQLKPERLVEPKIRKAFPDTAFWATDLTTDAAGRAQANFAFPDSLTTWRATARGVTADTKVGAAMLKTIVRKNLILRLAVPRFFVQGDEVTISAIVHNYLATAKTARVSLDLDGLDVIDGSTREVQIQPRGEAKVDWRVKARQVRSAKLTGKALTNEESDALELQLPVNIPGVKAGEAHGGALTAGASTTFDIAFPGKPQPGSRELSIRLSPSIAGSLFSALEYLVTFPYGCVEQTMSSFLPNIVVTQAITELGLKTRLDPVETQRKIRAGLDRLYNFQHEDGGWGWWETDESHPFMTAYVVTGLVQAKNAKVQVEDERIGRGVEWLRKSLATDSKLNPDLRAYMVYALTVAGGKQTALLDGVYEKRSSLSPYGLALAGLVFETAQDARAGAIADALEGAAQRDGEQVWWQSKRDPLLDFSEDASPEASAYAVKFLSHLRPSSPLLPNAAIWLMNHRNEGYWWNSTKQTAMVIYGLTDYLKASGELNPNVTATVYVNEKAVLTKKLDQTATLGAPELVLDETKVQPGTNHIRVTTAGQGRVYYSVRADAYSIVEQPIRSAGLSVQREYFRLASRKEGDKIVYDMQPLSGAVSSGDTLAVRLTVGGTESKYLMVEDPIPAGAEFIARDAGYEIKGAPARWQYYFSRRELHDDRMAIFQTWFPRGEQQYMYLLKVVNPGVFQVSPARAAPMYNHGVAATTEARTLEVK